MPKLLSDEEVFGASPGGLLTDEQVFGTSGGKESPGTASQTVAALVRQYGIGSGQLVAGVGQALQAPGATAKSLGYGALAAVDRGVNWLTRKAGGEGTDDSPALRNARVAAEEAVDQRRSNVEAGGLAASLGLGLQAMGDDAQRDHGAMLRTEAPEAVRQGEAIQKADGFIGTLKAMFFNPLGTAGTVAQSMPGMVVGAGAAGVAGKSVGAVSRLAGAGEATASRLALGAAENAGVVSEAGMSAMQNQQQVQDFVRGIPVEKLAQDSEQFRQIMRTPGMTPQRARDLLAEQLGAQSALPAGLWTGAINKATGAAAAIGKTVVTGRASARELAGGIAKESIEEGLQNPGENLAQYGAQVEADPTQKFDLGGSIAQGLVSGAAMAAPLHGSGYVQQKVEDFRAGRPAVPPNAPVVPQSAPPVAPGAPSVAPPAAAVAAPSAGPTEAERALFEPRSLTSLDRVQEIDGELPRLQSRLAELNRPDAGYGPTFDSERQDVAAQADALRAERDGITKSWPKTIDGAETTFTTEAGARVQARYALVDAGDLVTSHDQHLRVDPAYPKELQPRERDRAASEMQVSGIVQRLDPARLGQSADAANGAPIIGADGLVESGNARTIALKRVYRVPGEKADSYKAWLRENAEAFGVHAADVDLLQRPVLVRVRQTPVDRAEFARQANASTVAAMSPSEQAKSDAARIDSMEDLHADDNGDFSGQGSSNFVRRFMARLPSTEQAGMMDSAGRLSSTGYARVRNAVLARAYGDSPVLARMTESLDDNQRNISRALLIAAPDVAKMRDAIKSGVRHDSDLTPDLLAAVEEMARLKEVGSSVHDALAQAGLMGDKYSPETREIMQFLADNIRRPRHIADFIGATLAALEAAGDPNQASMFGDSQAPAKTDLIQTARRALDATATTTNTQRGNSVQDAKPGSQAASESAANQGNRGGDQGTEAAGSKEGQREPAPAFSRTKSSDWVSFPEEFGSLNIPRAQMPQLPGDARGALVQFLKARGIEATTEMVPADSLKPTQLEFSPEKAKKWETVREGSDRSVLVASDGHILDGHHQWVAALAGGESIKAIRFDAPIRELIAQVEQFPSVKRGEGANVVDLRAQARQAFKDALGDLAEIASKHTRVAMMPQDTPKLMPTLVKLMTAGIQEVGYSLKDLVAYVKGVLKADPQFKTVWNKISSDTYRLAAQQALEGAQKSQDEAGALFETAPQESAPAEEDDGVVGLRVAQRLSAEWQRELGDKVKVVMGGSLISGTFVQTGNDPIDMDVRFLSDNPEAHIADVERVTGLKLRKTIQASDFPMGSSTAYMIEGYLTIDGKQIEVEGSLRSPRYVGWAGYYRQVFTPKELATFKADKLALKGDKKAYKARKNQMLEEAQARAISRGLVPNIAYDIPAAWKLVDGKLIDDHGFERGKDLNSLERFAEQQFYDRLQADLPGVINDYLAREGNIVDADLAKNISSIYRHSAGFAHGVHEPSSLVSKKAWVEALSRDTSDTVVLTAGGAGSGKSFAGSLVRGKLDLPDDVLTFDSALSSEHAADARIQDSINAGKKVVVIYTNTDATTAFEWSLKRPRLMSAPLVASSHARAAKNIIRLAQLHDGSSNVRIVVVNNPGEQALVNIGTVSDIPVYDYNDLERKFHEIARKEFDAGRISERAFGFVSGETLGGSASREVQGVARRGDDGAPGDRGGSGTSGPVQQDGELATYADVGGLTDANIKSRQGSDEGQGAAAPRPAGGKRSAEPVRAGSGQPDLFDDRVEGAGGSSPEQVGQPGPTGVRGQDENSGQPAQRGRAARPAGVPAGRDIPPKSGLNYRFGADDLTYAGSWQAKAEQNVAAVELLKKLQADGRQATPDEQKVLAKFIGWGSSELANTLFGDKLDKNAGGLTGWKTVQQLRAEGVTSVDRFSPGYYGIYNAAGARYGDRVDLGRLTASSFGITPDIARWADLRERLKAALTADEWATASRSTQYAHYTSKPVVASMWRAVERMGFKGGAVLEPGAGIGVFHGLMPEAMANNSIYTGIEFDPITGGILKQLLPDERILVESFVDTQLPKNFYDAAVGNPPFSGTQILSDPEYAKRAFALHDYFFAKTIDRVKPGGLVVFVTSRYTMDKLGDKARAYLAERADLVGAVRLPQTAFKANAGTEVVTDVLFLRKKVPGETFEHAQPWLKSVPLKVNGAEYPVNEYFHAHPEMVLGEHSDAGSMYKDREYTVTPRAGDMEVHFDAAVGQLPENIYKAERGSSAEAAQVREIDFNPLAKKEGGYYVTPAGVVMQREGGIGSRVDKPAGDLQLLKDFVPLRDALKQAHYDQLNDGAWEQSLAALNKAYEAFVAKHGPVNQFKERTRKVKAVDEDTGEAFTDEDTVRVFTLESKLRDDPDWTLVAALEKINDETGAISPSDFLSKRVLGKSAEARIDTASDALLSTLNDLGHVDMATIAARLGMSEREAAEALGSAVYEDPSDGWVTADQYLSGNVKRKLNDARQAAKADRRYERNVQALEAAQPDPKTPNQINAAIGMNWIPGEIYQDFLRETAGVKARIEWLPRTKEWVIEEKSGGHTLVATADWGTGRRNITELMEHALTGRQIRIESKMGKDEAPKLDDAATEAANEKLNKLREAFSAWLWRDAGRADKLVQLYNDKFNTTVPRSFDGRHLTLPGTSKTFSVFDHVKRGAWRIIQSGNTYLAHAVGSGKTFQMVISAMEQKRLGLINKPMMVVPNHMLQQFASEWQQLYPAARLMVADENHFHKDNRRRFVSRVALTDLDGVVITHSAFKLLDLDPAFKRKMIEEQLTFFRAALIEAGGNPDKTGKSRDPKIKRIEKQIERMEQRLEKAMTSDGKDKNVRFDELGVDFLYVDEAHEFRKLDYTTNRQVKGLSPDGSARAFDLYMKSRYLEEKTPGRSLVMASGTPITNTLAELYSVQKFMDEAALRDRGIEDFDSWAAMFGRESTGLEPDASGKYHPVTRFNRFVNIPELTQMFRNFADVLNSDHLAALLGDKRPKVDGGSRRIIVTPKTQAYRLYQHELAARYEVSRKWKPSKDQPNNPDPIIKIIGDGRLAAIDQRFVMPGLENDPDSKLNRMIDDVIAKAKESADMTYLDKAGNVEPAKGAAMMVFSDLGFGAGVAASRGFNARAWMEKRLRDAGIPPGQVAFMSDFKKSTDKLKLFKDVNAGRVRILVGSSKNMGTGVNAQQRLKYEFHLDSPWYPADLEQREGRIIRQGNKNPLVQIYAYAAKGSYDEAMWKMLASKQAFIDQGLSGDTNVREIEDLDSVSQLQLAAGLVAEDPRVLQLAGAQADVAKLQRLYQGHEDQRQRFRSEYRRAADTVSFNRDRLPHAEEDAKKVQDLSGDAFKAKVGGTVFKDRAEWATALLARFDELSSRAEEKDTLVGQISGFDVTFRAARQAGQYTPRVDLDTPVQTTLAWDKGTSPIGLTMRAQNAVADVARLPAKLRERITEASATLDALSSRLETPFPMSQMLADKIKEMQDLEAELEAAGKAKPFWVERKSDGTGFTVEAANAEDAVASAIESNGGSADEWEARPAQAGDKPAMARGDEAPASERSGTVEHVQQLAQEIAKAWVRGPKVVVVQSLADPRVPEAVREANGQQASQDASGVPAGVYYRGVAYLVAPQLQTDAEVTRVLAHEVLGHHGLRSLYGDALDSILTQIYQARTADVTKKATEYGLDVADRDDRLAAAEEVLAEMAEKQPELGFVRRTVAAIRTWLRDNMPGFKGLHLSDDEIIRNWILPARRFVERGQDGGNAVAPLLAGGARFKLGNQTAEQRADAIIKDAVKRRAPVDYLARQLTRLTGVERLTGAIYARAGWLLDRYTPEQVKAGVISDYGVPEAVIDQRALMQGRQRVQLRQAGNLIEKLSTLTRAESRVAYAWMNEEDPAEAARLMDELPAESVKVLGDVAMMIDRLSRDAVAMGQLPAEAFERHRFAYLRRSYAKHILEQTSGEKAKRSRVISILGDQYKGRGLTEAATMAQVQNLAPEWWKRKTKDGKADTALKGEKFVRLERRAASGEGTVAMEGIGDRPQGKLLEVAYYPAGEPLPVKYADWDQRGTFEVRDVQGAKLVLWRDFTKAEREQMGEIDEARFAIAKTLHGMIHDVEVGRYLEWLAHRYALKPGQEVPGNLVDASERFKDTFAPDDWVKVPDTKISGTSTLKYGKLSGRYLPGPIWNDLRQVVGGQFKPFGDTYAKVLSMWKTAKTALSPAVHLNNIMSNFVMADWHDVSAVHVSKALRIILGGMAQDRTGVLGRAGNALSRGGIGDREAARAILNRYKDSGGDLGSWTTNELAAEQLEPLLNQLENELQATGGASMQAQVGVMSALQHALMLRFPSAWEAFKASKTGKVVGNEAKNLIELYSNEDEVFRLAAWLKAKEEGADDLAAGKRARQSFLDYRINAPWIAAMRQSAWPFVSFTYRALPMLAEIAGKKPHKLMKLMVLAGLLNAMGFALSGGDEDKERKSLPEEKAGRIWGLVPKLIRMPWNDANGSPVFLDIRRFIPVGDVFDTGSNHAAIPVLPGLMPGGPLVTMGEVALNKQAFTGKPITLETDTAFQQASKVAEYLWQTFAPNLLGVPGTYATQGVQDAMKGRTDVFGREQSTTQALVSAVGIKLGSYPIDVQQRNLRAQAQAQQMEIDKNISQLKRQLQTHRISQDEFQKSVQLEMEKKRKLQADLQKKL